MIYRYGDHPLMVKLQDSRSKLVQKLSRLAEMFESTSVAETTHRLSEISDAFHWESSQEPEDVPSNENPSLSSLGSKEADQTPFDLKSYSTALTDIQEADGNASVNEPAANESVSLW